MVRPARSNTLRTFPLQRLPISGLSYAGAQFLSDDYTEVLEWRERSMKALKCLVGGLVAKRVDEELRVEDVLASAANHRSGSGAVISIPSMARVPSTSSR